MCVYVDISKYHYFHDYKFHDSKNKLFVNRKCKVFIHSDCKLFSVLRNVKRKITSYTDNCN